MRTEEALEESGGWSWIVVCIGCLSVQCRVDRILSRLHGAYLDTMALSARSCEAEGSAGADRQRTGPAPHCTLRVPDLRSSLAVSHHVSDITPDQLTASRTAFGCRPTALVRLWSRADVVQPVLLNPIQRLPVQAPPNLSLLAACPPVLLPIVRLRGSPPVPAGDQLCARAAVHCAARVHAHLHLRAWDLAGQAAPVEARHDPAARGQAQPGPGRPARSDRVSPPPQIDLLTPLRC